LLTTILLIIALAAAFYMAWNIGANDVANSMATAVGGKAISLKQAVIIAGILEMAGAVLLGSHVTNTVGKGIVDLEAIGDPDVVIIGMLAALIAASIGVTLSTWKSMPVSTSHFIVGAVMGFGLISGGQVDQDDARGVGNWDSQVGRSYCVYGYDCVLRTGEFGNRYVGGGKGCGQVDLRPDGRVEVGGVFTVGRHIKISIIFERKELLCLPWFNGKCRYNTFFLRLDI